MSGIIICIANNKGGIGKTSVTCSLGSALSLKGKKVLVVDNDPQANTTGILISRNTVVRKSLYELIDPSSNDAPIENCIYPATHKNLYCLPNIEETAGLELDFAAQFPESNLYLRNKIRDYAKENFDFTLIDCPPTLGLFVSNALHASDCVIVPIDAASAYSLDGLRKVVELIETIKQTDNPDLRFLRLLINRVDKRTVVTHVIIDDIKERFGESQTFKTHIPVNTPFQQAEYARETIFNFAATSRGAKSYRALATELIAIFDK